MSRGLTQHILTARKAFSMNVRKFTSAAALSLLASTATMAQAPVPRAPDAKPRLEMVFVLDTTGSMGGLIEGARQKIWGIVNDVLKTPHPPSVRVGLVAYRDHGDDYVTKVLPITSDLDKVYSTLLSYRAEGGGDTPEDVRQALADGVDKVGWSPRARHLSQILFLVGDAPPHDDYGQEPDTVTTTAKAVKNGLIVNAIECGAAEDTRVSWQKIASRGEGQFFAIAEDGGVQTITTPYDKSLASLGTMMGNTYMAYGGGVGGGFPGGFRAENARRNAAAEGVAATAASAPVAADRAFNKAMNRDAYANDLLQSLDNGTVTFDTIKTEDLPDDLQKLAPAARRQEIEKRLTARRAVRAKILALSKQRETYLEAERKKASGGKQTGFDAAVSAALKTQMARRGVGL